jgi:CHASE3 domain sensor protein
MSSVAASKQSGALSDSRHGILRELGLPALFGAAVLFFSATMLLGVNISAMRNNLAWIQHTQNILREISTAEFGIVGDELTVRSYALTGDSRFLQYQKMERKRLLDAVARLEKLAAMEPGGAARMRAIRQSVLKHMDLYMGITGLGPDKATVVANVINDDVKRKVMFASRGALAAYRADEVRILGERQENLTKQLSQAFFLAIGIIVAAFALGGLGLLMAQFRIPMGRQ